MEDYIEITLKVVAKVRRFSDLSIHTKNAWSQINSEDYDVTSSCILASTFFFQVCPNSRIPSDESGSVSVEVFIDRLICNRNRDVQTTIVLSVSDAEGNSRFPRSFLFFQEIIDLSLDLTIDDYISRSVLLNEPSEFLPDDTLTLEMDIVIRSRHDSHNFYTTQYMKNFLSLSRVSQDKFSLDLDSPSVKDLARESRYFQRILESPMREQNTRTVILPFEEYGNFELIEQILMGVQITSLQTLVEIFDLYTTADKYDFPTVLDVCRRWLKLYLCPENVSEISEFADLYGDDRLKEVVRDFQRNKEDGAIGNSSNWDEEWSVSYPTKDDSQRMFMRYLLSAKQKNENNEEDKNGSDVFNIYI